MSKNKEIIALKMAEITQEMAQITAEMATITASLYKKIEDINNALSNDFQISRFKLRLLAIFVDIVYMIVKKLKK